MVQSRVYPWYLCVLTICAAEVTDKQYAAMPELFYMENFDHCMMYEDDALFCQIRYDLQPVNPRKPPETWKTIQEVNSDPFNYKHDQLRHWICVTQACPNVTASDRDDPTLKNAINECYNKKYQSLGYKGTITQILCETNTPRYPINAADIIYAVVMLSYLGLVAYGTYFEAVTSYQPQELYEKIMGTTKGKFLTAFSIKKNWFRLVTVNSTPDVERLRCIQGMRVYNMAVVILAHTVLTYVVIPISNTKYTETMLDKVATIFLASGPLCVATFFVMSSFLLSYGVFDSFKDKKEISFKFLILSFINRYVRLTPTLLVMVGFHATWWRHLGRGPFWNTMAEEEYLRCRKNWWTNLLYINNIVNREDMCLQTTWYLSLDTQYFAVVLLLLWVLKKYEKQIWIILGTLLAANMVATFCENYSYRFAALHIPMAEEIYMMKNTIKSIQWHHQLASIIGNTAPPLVGIGAGYILFKQKNRKIFDSQIKHVVWWINTWVLAFGVTILPGLVVLKKFGESDPVWASLHVAFSRPLFSIAMASLILGVSEGLGSFTKWALEWRPTYVLGRLTFSSYLVHMSLVLLRPALGRFPIYASDYAVMRSLLGDLAVTYLAATVLTLLLELPISELQKLLVPQKGSKRQAPSETKVEESKNK